MCPTDYLEVEELLSVVCVHYKTYSLKIEIMTSKTLFWVMLNMSNWKEF